MCHKIYSFMDFQRQEIIYHNKSGSYEAVDSNNNYQANNNNNSNGAASESHRVDNGRRSSRPASAPSKIINTNNNNNSLTTLKAASTHIVLEDVFVEDSNCHSDFFIPQHTAQHDIVRDEKLGHAAKLRKLAAKFYSTTSDDGDSNEAANHDSKQQQQGTTTNWKEGVDMHDIYKSDQADMGGGGGGGGGGDENDNKNDDSHPKAESNRWGSKAYSSSLRLMKKRSQFSRTSLFLAPSRQQQQQQQLSSAAMMPNSSSSFISKRKRGGAHSRLPMDVRVPRNIVQDSIYDHAYGNHDIGSRGHDFNELNVPLPGTSTHGSASNWVKLMERTIAASAAAAASPPPRANANADYERDHGWRTAQDWDYQGNKQQHISLKHHLSWLSLSLSTTYLPTYLPSYLPVGNPPYLRPTDNSLRMKNIKGDVRPHSAQSYSRKAAAQAAQLQRHEGSSDMRPVTAAAASIISREKSLTRIPIFDPIEGIVSDKQRQQQPLATEMVTFDMR